jgi:hypothetical protein
MMDRCWGIRTIASRNGEMDEIDAKISPFSASEVSKPNRSDVFRGSFLIRPFLPLRFHISQTCRTWKSMLTLHTM